MLVSPRSLDWKRQPNMGPSIVWHPSVYNNFADPLQSTLQPLMQLPHWETLPFEDAQIEKIPQRSGIYVMVYQYRVLAVANQEVILYLGETEDLRDRVRQHLSTSRQSLQGPIQVAPKTHDERMKLLFRIYTPLSIRYCPLDLPTEERLQLERELIGLFDPPFNVKHRPVPQGRPMLSRPGTIAATTGSPRPAFPTRQIGGRRHE